jgi:membrane protease YdiL (CAAX protease family)
MNDEIPQSLIPLLLTILLGGAAAWSVIALRVWRGKPILDYESRRPVPWNWVDLLLTLLVFFANQMACMAAAFHWLGIEDNIAEAIGTPQGRLALLVATAISGLMTFLLSALLVAYRSGASVRDLGFVAGEIPHDIMYGLVAFFAAAPIVYLIQVFFSFVVKIEYDHPLVKAIQQQRDATTIAIVTFTAVVAAPLSEEFLIRVLLQGWLEKLELSSLDLSAQDNLAIGPPPLPGSDEAPVTGNAEAEQKTPNGTIGLAGLPLGSIPILVSSLLFALMHVGQGAAPIPLFVYALVLGFLYHRTHRALPSIVAHCALNSTSVAMLFLTPM